MAAKKKSSSLVRAGQGRSVKRQRTVVQKPASKYQPIDDYQAVKTLVERIVAECPRRQPASADEHRAQQIMKQEFERLGMDTHEEAFRFNDNLYANLALHFGLGFTGSVISGLAPLPAFICHMLAGTSYWAESTRRAYILRRLFPFKPSQNILAVMPAEGEPALRVVFLAHADAAFTGLIFNPEIIKKFTHKPPLGIKYLNRSMAVTTHSQFLLAGFDLLRMFLGPLTWPLRPLEAAISIPSFLAFVLNLHILIKNEIVPGANDDLSGVAALPILAQRLGPDKRPDVEYVFGVTGCEEASLGGGDALARDKDGVWDKKRTVVIGLDGLANGDLTYLEVEGEVSRTRIPAWLEKLSRETAASEPRFNPVKGFEVPVGGSDIAAFLARGWDGVCMCCVDPELGAPRHYHLPSDTPANLEVERVLYAIDFTEKLARNIVEHRLG